jgi:hypothetical protein
MDLQFMSDVTNRQAHLRVTIGLRATSPEGCRVYRSGRQVHSPRIGVRRKAPKQPCEGIADLNGLHLVTK